MSSICTWLVSNTNKEQSHWYYSLPWKRQGGSEALILTSAAEQLYRLLFWPRSLESLRHRWFISFPCFPQNSHPLCFTASCAYHRGWQERSGQRQALKALGQTIPRKNILIWWELGSITGSSTAGQSSLLLGLSFGAAGGVCVCLHTGPVLLGNTP